MHSSKMKGKKSARDDYFHLPFRAKHPSLPFLEENTSMFVETPETLLLSRSSLAFIKSVLLSKPLSSPTKIWFHIKFMGKYSCIYLYLFLLLWSLRTKPLFLCMGVEPSKSCIESERLALVKFKAGMKDPHQLLSSWQGDDCCTWRGVGCSNESWHVVALDLRYQHLYDGLATDRRLSGEINPSLLDLLHLNHLDLSSNNFRGKQIPNFIGSLPKLSYLNLSNAGFFGRIPSWLGNLTRLKCLDLNSFHDIYHLHADSLRWLSSLSALEHLDMSGVNLGKASDWFHELKTLPALSVLLLPNCQLPWFPSPTIPHGNLTSLEIIDLQNNNINSTFPTWLLNCSSLVHLDLWFNHFHGPIPDAIGKLTFLEVLQLGFNDFLGPLPTTLGDLCNLHTLDLSFNKMNGEITALGDVFSGCISSSIEILNLRSSKLEGELSDWLGTLKRIKIIDLSSSCLYGSVPASIGNLSTLRSLSLTNNELNGTLPESIGQLSELRILDVSFNALDGVVSEAHFTNLSLLEALSMSWNSIVLNISTGWIPPFHLGFIGFRSCHIGPKFPTWLKTQRTYSTLDLSNTKIADTLPEWFWDLPRSIAYIDLSYNQISGTIPKSFKFASAAAINLKSNKFEGPLPPLPSNAAYVDLSDNSFSGDILPISGGYLPVLGHLHLSNNQINGTIPASICNFSLIQVLDLSNNRFSGELPMCWANLRFLVAVNLANNSLTGAIPSSMGALTLIEVLHLGNNNISGQVPSSLRNCNILITLDLGGNRIVGKIPTWIGESLHLLRILRLRSNMFHGDIPRELANLTSLQILDLAENILSGDIPQEFGNFAAMRQTNGSTESILGSFNGQILTSIGDNYSVGYEERLSVVIKGRELEYTKTLGLFTSMDLSSNQLSGEIPEQLGKLQGVRSLNLSRNHLNATIPASICSLRTLESLDLSQNDLTGEIPPCMSVLTSLSHLNLSCNNLSGRIPSGYQLQTLNDPSIYIGNANLCGPPLEEQCGSNETVHGLAPWELGLCDAGDDCETETLWLYIGGAMGYVLSLWAVCFGLLFNEAWRNSCFRFIDYVNLQLADFVKRKRH